MAALFWTSLTGYRQDDGTHRFENYYIEMNGIFCWDLPYLLGYFLTGTIGSEYTIATTTQRYNPTTKDWEKAYQKLLTLLK